MVRRWVASSVVGLSCLGSAACNMNSAPPGSSPGTAANTVKPPVETGAALYKAEPAEKLALVGGLDEQIVVPNAVVRLDEKQTVPAQIDGYLQIIGTPLPPNTPYDANSADIVFDPSDAKKQKPYRRLREGMRVVEGQEVALFNDLEVLVQIESNQRLIRASDSAIAAANKACEAVRKVLQALESIKDAASKSEVLNQLATLARYEENVVSAEKERVRAEGDEKRAWAQHTKHRARCMVREGIITKVMRSPGDFLKAGEPIMEILSTDRQQVEGNLDAKDAWAVVPGMKVTVEPAVPTGPDALFGTVNHRQEVTGVAVTAHPTRPLIVSTSLDGTAVVWDVMPPDGKPRGQTRLPHPSGVRSVATTGTKAGAKMLAATGGDDGKVRVWDLTNPDKLGEKPLVEGDEAHAAAVAAVAFSPDGKYLATAAGREVFIWTAATGKKLYALPAEHKDAVTTVRFTPQSTLVTAGRDKTVRVWTVGEKAAGVAKLIDHRKGTVETLGVSSGGGRMLFDQDDGRIDVIGLSDGRAVGSVQNTAASARFSTLALFSADDSLVLTSGADGDSKGELQVWNTPTAGGRASERRRLVTPYRAAPTAAAFGQHADQRFVAVGTQAGGVHLFTLSAAAEMLKVRTGVVLSVLRLDPRTVKVQVRTDAVPGEAASLLQNNAAATIIIKPNDPASRPALPLPAAGAAMTPAAPANPMVVPAGGLMPAGGVIQTAGAAPAAPPVVGPAPVLAPDVSRVPENTTPVVNPPAGGLVAPVVTVPTPSLTTPNK